MATNITRVTHSINNAYQKGFYNIYTGENASLSILDILREERADRVFTVSDTNVYPLHGSKFERDGSFIFPAGESSKTLDTVCSLYIEFHNANLTRSSIVLALGGGVTGDIAAFAAASYMRGIRVIQIPTTLLSQIDSSIGGKCGVNMPYAKNAVGAFHNPCAVISDQNFLLTLPPQYVKDGLGEALKYAVIGDGDLFDLLRSGNYTLDEIIPACQNIKAKIVSNDEFEQNERKLLNLGHTFAHAIEKCEMYTGMTHGLAVGVGLFYAAQMSEALGIAARGLVDQIYFALSSLGLPTSTNIPPQELMSAILSDKKRSADRIALALPRQIGKCEIVMCEIAKIAELLGAK